ncbi:YidH family protein [Bacillus sp. EB01]|uniref:YidH family protein n=1 Tax=Bacillus sp. EB01 TaxID=1347086 RepID=UPI0005C4C65E|nr:DUF202 domain-containing protein [Bacillus sp. EB01]
MDDAKQETKTQTTESKYIQQHLANERTYLAWIRTAIAIIGVGFLVTNLHFTMKTSLTPAGDLFANLIGISSVLLGIIVIVIATVAYIRKIDAINTQTFRAPKRSIIGLGVFIILITIFFGVYFTMVNF